MAALMSVFVALFLVRFVLAWRFAGRFVGGTFAGSVAVLQPILGGDPLLEESLRANAVGLAGARLYWLVDEDDLVGQAATRGAALGNVRVIVGPGPVDGENPKVAKLGRALDVVTEDVVVVLDDDTRLGGAELGRLVGALAGADLVTGLPVFGSRGNFFERFVGGFVNGNAVLTYLPAAAVGEQHTINGMIYAVRADVLRGLGGFRAIVSELTDDYAMAQLFERAGRRILQTPVCVDVGMTIRDAGHCGRVLRRWFLFANRYLGENVGVALVALVVVPSVLPVAGIFFGWWWVLLLVLKACGNRFLLWRVSGRGSGVLDILFEVLADVFAPLFYVSALWRPRELSWRSRRIAMDGGRIRYR